MEIYQKDIEKQKQTIDKVTEEKLKLERRIVLLENDNNDYINKIRELDCWSDELRRKLDATLEENIVQNNEFEAYKLEMEENFERLKEELEDAKNEITSKQTIIERMTKQRDFLVKSACKDDDDDYNTMKFIKSCRSVKHVNRKKDKSFGNLINPSLGYDENKLKVPVLNKSDKIPNKFMQSYSNSCLELEILEQEQDKIEEKEGMDSIFNKNIVNLLEIDSSKKNIFNINSEVKMGNYATSEYASANITPIHNKLDVDDIIVNSIAEKTKKSYVYSNLHTPVNVHTPPLQTHTPVKEIESKCNFAWNENGEDDREFIRNKIELEIQNILDNRKIFMQQALTQENFSFDFLSNNKFCASPNNRQKYTNMNKEKLLKNIEDMLSKIQERKEKIITQKKLIETKIEKVGVKIF
jgi:hypothetical protein